MTVSTTLNYAEYVINSIGPYVVGFSYDQDADLTVTVVNNNQTSKVLQLGYDYNLSPTPNIGGHLTLSNTAFTAYNGWLIYIERDTPPIQPNRFREQGPYSSRTTEACFDRNMMALQDASSSYARAIKVPKWNRAITSTDIQNVGASKVLQFSPDGTGIRAVYPRDIFLDQEEAAINVPIQQLNHGFATGQWLTLANGTFVLADSSTAALAETVGCITKIIDADNFILSSTGQITCLTGLNPGSVYFLGHNGNLSLTNNSTPGQISKPLLVAQSPNSGFIVNYRGRINPDSNAGGQHNVTNTITQANHGFLVGQMLYYSVANNEFGLAVANDALKTCVIGMCVETPDANTFTIITNGYIDQMSFPTTGILYLSDTTPGTLTATEPTTSGHYSVALLDATSLTDGYFFNCRPRLISNSSGTPVQATSNTTARPGELLISYTNVNGTNIFTLPQTAQIGDSFRVVGYNGVGWSVAQAAGQQVGLLDTYTTRGVSGSVSSTSPQDAIDVVVTAVNNANLPTDFVIASVVGNLNFI